MNISNENRPGDDEVVHMIRCEDCGHMVPAPNLTIHQVTACAGRARAHSSDEEEEEKNRAAATGDNRAQQQSEDDAHHEVSQQQEQQSLRQRRRRARNGDSNEGMVIHSERPLQPAPASLDISNAAAASRPAPQVITIPDSPPSATAPAAAAMPSSPAANEWSCPRCTLLNSNSQNLCSACGYHRGGSNTSPDVRAPDATRRDTLLPTQPASPGAAIGSGALLGSVLGAAGAYLNGRPMSSGAFEGAMSGAMGAAIVSSVWNQPGGGAPAMSPSQRAFASAPSGHAALHPRPSFRVVRHRNPDGSISESVYVHSPSAAGMPLDRSASDLMMRQHLAMMRALGGGMGRGVNPDNMSYEQMLEMFGDGSENRGATERDIRALPVSTVKDPSQLPEDKRQCSICLEDFKPGDERKVMGCLHGFHSECLDKWLRTNGSCPVCKHRVSTEG